MAFDVDPARQETRSKAAANNDEPIPKRGHQWELHASYHGILVWLLLCHLAGIVIFSRGFLLNRVLSEEQSTTTSPVISNDRSAEWPSSSSHGCWHPKTFDRAVILVVDALRYDFVAPVPRDDVAHNARYHNRMKSVHKALEERSRNSLLYEFVADPPTTTLQRITALTTGTLPTFIDAGSNFGGQAVTEDNLIRQLKLAGKKIAFTGDDTWTALYPSEGDFFDRNLTFPFPSFDVHDLHTVDNGVDHHLLRLLTQADTECKWDVAVAHMLGLDHAGHRYGTEHELFSSKLDEVDLFIHKVMSKLDPDTLLIVMGDHGMTAKGDHGGESILETNSALFLYSAGQQLTTPSISLAQTWNKEGSIYPTDSIISGKHGSSSGRTGLSTDWHKPRIAYQIDMVPTISLLLGLPIPHNSLGSVIPEPFFRASWTLDMRDRKKAGFGHWETLLRAIRVNSHQIRRFVRSYLAQNRVSPVHRTRFRAIDQDFEKAEKLWKRALTDTHMSDERATESFTAFEYYNRRALYQARLIWARFDSRLMVLGISLLSASLAVSLFILFSGWPIRFKEKTCVGTTIWHVLSGALLGLALGLGWCTKQIGSSLGTENDVSPLLKLDVCLFAMTGSSLIAFAVSVPRSGRFETDKQDGIFGLITAIICSVLHALSYFSNSYTIHEDRTTLFLIGTCVLLIIKLVSGSSNARLVRRGLGISLMLWALARAISLFRVCRDEQGALCSVTFYGSKGTSAAPLYVFLLNLVLTIYLLPSMIIRTLQLSQSTGGFGLELAHGACRLLAICAMGYWTLDTYALTLAIEERLAVNYKLLMALLLIFFSIVAFTVWSGTPLMIDVMQHQTSQGGSKIVVIGWANALGAPLFLFYTLLSLIFAFVQKPTGWLTLALGLGQLCCLLESVDTVHDIRALGRAKKPDLVNNPSYLASVILALCGFLWYFATGHQATFTSIQWDSAFIGLSALKYPLGPILVILNTFSPFILVGAAAPLLAVWNITPQAGPDPPSALMYRSFKSSLAVMTYFHLLLVASTIASSYLRRHLMVWAIFAPRYMLAASALLAVDFGCIIFGFGYASLIVLRKVRIFFGTEYL